MQYILKNISSENLYLTNNLIDHSASYENNTKDSIQPIQNHAINSQTTLVYNTESNFGKTKYRSKLARVFRTTKSNKYFTKKRQLKTVLVNLKQVEFSTENGFCFELLLVGLGFKVVRVKILDMLQFELHFSHKLCYIIPKEVNVRCIKKKLVLFGIDKSKLVNVAEKIKAFRYPNTYKGKGIKYFDEIIKLKPGKQR